MLSISRVIGETAPLLIVAGFTTSMNYNPFADRMMSLPVFVYNQYVSPGHRRPVLHRARLGRGAHPHPDRRAAQPHRAHRLLLLLAEARPLTPDRSRKRNSVQAHRSPRSQRLLRQLPGRRGRLAEHRTPNRHRVHRPVRLRQVDLHPHAEPHARGHPRRARRGRGADRRQQPLRPRRRPGARAPAGRHGVPAPEPVPDDVDQGERARGREAQQPQDLEDRRRRPGREVAARAPTSGTRSRTASTSPARASRAVSSSVSASRARSPSRPR